MDDTFPISIEQFASLIEERPNLWDNSLKRYKHRATTRNTWREILMKMYPDFYTWDKKKRLDYTKKTLKKWRYIRDTFLKSYKKIERQRMYGRPVAKRYMYYRHLSFLAKIARRPTNGQPAQITTPTQVMQTNKLECTVIKSEIVEPYENCIDETSSMQASDILNQNYDAQIVVPQNTELNLSTNEPTNVFALKKHSTKSLLLLDGKMTKAGTKHRHVSFFNSLIPTLDKFDDDQVIEFQLGVLKLMKEIKTPGIPNTRLLRQLKVN